MILAFICRGVRKARFTKNVPHARRTRQMISFDSMVPVVQCVEFFSAVKVQNICHAPLLQHTIKFSGGCRLVGKMGKGGKTYQNVNACIRQGHGLRSGMKGLHIRKACCNAFKHGAGGIQRKKVRAPARVFVQKRLQYAFSTADIQNADAFFVKSQPGNHMVYPGELFRRVVSFFPLTGMCVKKMDPRCITFVIFRHTASKSNV